MADLSINNGGIFATGTKPSIDNFYGPYASVQEAYNYLSDNDMLIVGRTVGILINNAIEEYWFAGGTTIDNLVSKKPDLSGIENDISALQSGKQDVIQDLSTIRSGASAGATAQQPATSLSGYGITDAYTRTQVDNSLATKANTSDVNTALAGKQDVLTFDNTPTAGSTNPVTSGGVKAAIDAVETVIEDCAYLGDNDGESVIADFDPQSDTLWKKTQVLSNAEKATVKNNLGITQDLEQMNQRLNAQDAAVAQLDGHALVIVDTLPTDASPAETPDPDVIYRLYVDDGQGNVSYEDYMYNTSDMTTPIKIATYALPGVDEEPTYNSNNLVKSDGVYKSDRLLSQQLAFLNFEIRDVCTIPNRYIKQDGSIGSLQQQVPVYYVSDFLPVKEGHSFKYQSTNLGTEGYAYAIYDSEKGLIGETAYGRISFNGTVNIEQANARYIRFAISTNGVHSLSSLYNLLGTVDNINKTVSFNNDIGSLPLFSHLNDRFALLQKTTTKNLITDFSKFVYGRYINGSGGTGEAAAFAYYDDFLEIPTGETKVTISYAPQFAIALYDSNKEFIETIGSTNNYDRSFDLSSYTTAQYIKVNIVKSTIPTHPNYDGIHPCYVYFGKKYEENPVTPTPVVTEIRTYGNVIKKPITLQGKNITFFGDSITAGYSSTTSGIITDCYAKLLGDYFGATVDNRGMSNTRICDPNNSVYSILNRVLNYSGNPDVIFIAGGTNDYGHNPQSPIGNFDDAVYSTLFGALNLMCQHLKTNYPNVPVVFITPINRTNSTAATSPTLEFNDLRNAIWRVAVNNGYSVIDGSKLEGFAKFGEASLPIKSQLLADGLHPTNIGHVYMANYISGLF